MACLPLALRVHFTHQKIPAGFFVNKASFTFHPDLKIKNTHKGCFLFPVVEGEGFEPSNSYEGRFTVCCH